ncbi:MAG: hypothetical protein AAFP82_07540 [Bacteroidota bacterium]
MKIRIKTVCLHLIILFSLGCKSQQPHDVEIGSLIENYLDNNLELRSQDTGVYTYDLMIRIGKSKSKVKSFDYSQNDESLAEDLIHSDLIKCLKSFKKEGLRRNYKMRIIINTISFDFKVRIYPAGA